MMRERTHPTVDGFFLLLSSSLFLPPPPPICSELRAVHGARVCTEAYRNDQTKITIILKGTKLSS